MKTKDILQCMADQVPCLVCNFAYCEMYKRGLGDIAFALRQLASELWSSDTISDHHRHFVNNRLASLVQNISGEEEKCKYTVQELVADLEREITSDSPLFESWAVIKNLIQEMMSGEEN